MRAVAGEGGEEQASRVSVVLVSYVRPTGQTGNLYVDPTWVSAVGDIANDQCVLLLNAEWLTINMSAKDFLALIGIDVA